MVAKCHMRYCMLFSPSVDIWSLKYVFNFNFIFLVIDSSSMNLFLYRCKAFFNHMKKKMVANQRSPENRGTAVNFYCKEEQQVSVNSFCYVIQNLSFWMYFGVFLCVVHCLFCAPLQLKGISVFYGGGGGSHECRGDFVGFRATIQCKTMAGADGREHGAPLNLLTEAL